MATSFGTAPPSHIVQGLLESKTRTGPSREEWECQRPLIKRLYVDEAMTLREVIANVSKSGHNATPRMYKDRIAKWGFDKKNKERDMLAILRKKNERDAIGKRSSFRVRGKIVTMEDVFHYLKRRKKAREMEMSAASTPSALSCWTPSPTGTPRPVNDTENMNANFGCSSELVSEPFSSMLTDEPSASNETTVRGWTSISPLVDDEEGFLTDEDFCTLLLEHDAVPRSPLPPQTFLLPERLFLDIKTYVHGSFDSGAWITDDDGYCVNITSINKESRSSPDKFMEHCNLAIDFLQQDLPVEFRRALSNASRVLQYILQDEHPTTLQQIAQALVNLVNEGLHDVASFLCRYISATASILPIKSLVWRQICLVIGRLDVNSLRESMEQTLRIVVDTFTAILGTWHSSTLTIYVEFISNLYGFSALSEHERLLRNLLSQLERSSMKNSESTLYVMVYLGNNLIQQGRHAEIEELGLDMVVRNWRGRYINDVARINSLRLLAASHFHQQKRTLAETNLCKVIELISEQNRSADTQIIHSTMTLEAWLREWGREDEADDLKAKIDELIGKDEIDEEIEAGDRML